ncbi:sperm flagellar protein 1-like [Osmia bicornis bicornis]|uniref:sperm flagellar protein 1-like n=1 Tax=Osmia bicornis bicornis TaxID=1437191 RepID=UPI0010F69801|nr:sperm flagellar protein 1-like [Osmia bicornis bicornis]
MSVESEASDKLGEIYTWIEQITFSKPKKNLARDFSDGVFMAELLKRYYPKYVDIHNYIPGNSVAKKIDNWCTLNRKVFSKLDMKLGKDLIKQLANSQPGVIEKVLIDLRAKILKDCNADRNSLYSEYDENAKNDEVKSVLNPEEIANKTVPRHVFVRLKQELEDKNEVINSLHQKLSHLQSLIKLKDQRISDLTSQIIKSSDYNSSSANISVTNSKYRNKV